MIWVAPQKAVEYSGVRLFLGCRILKGDPVNPVLHSDSFKWKQASDVRNPLRLLAQRHAVLLRGKESAKKNTWKQNGSKIEHTEKQDQDESTWKQNRAKMHGTRLPASRPPWTLLNPYYLHLFIALVFSCFFHYFLPLTFCFNRSWCSYHRNDRPDSSCRLAMIATGQTIWSRPGRRSGRCQLFHLNCGRPKMGKTVTTMAGQKSTCTAGSWRAETEYWGDVRFCRVYPW